MKMVVTYGIVNYGNRVIGEYPETDYQLVNLDMRKAVMMLLAARDSYNYACIPTYGRCYVSAEQHQIVEVFSTCPDVRDTSKMEQWQINNDYLAYEFDEVRPEHREQVMLLNAAVDNKGNACISGVGERRCFFDVLNNRNSVFYSVVDAESYDLIKRLHAVSISQTP